MTTSLPQPHTSTVLAIRNMSARRVQIMVAQVRPDDWKLFTERDGDAVRIYRWT